MLFILSQLFIIGGIINAILVIININMIYSIISMILTFLNIVGLFLLLGVDFLGLIYIIVYVGAIAILFLFVIMMLNVKKQNKFYNNIWSDITPILILILSIYILIIITFNIDNNTPSINFNIYNLIYDNTTIYNLGLMLYRYDYYYLIIISLILLIGMIGSIVLTIYHSNND